MAEQPYKEFTSGDHKYQVYPITGRQACHLDRKVIDISIRFGNAAGSKKEYLMMVTRSFAEMSEREFDDIVSKTVVDVVRIGNANEPDVKITPENVYDYFKGDIDGLYGFLMQLWEAYELTPFKKAKAVTTGA